jgi:small subunit ribosomal protein S17
MEKTVNLSNTHENELDAINKSIQESLKAERLLPRGMKLQGKVVSTKRKKTVTVQIDRVKKFKKYKRLAREISKIHAHVPGNIEIKDNDIVEIRQTRKISKTKAWVVTRIIKRMGS